MAARSLSWPSWCRWPRRPAQDRDSIAINAQQVELDRCHLGGNHPRSPVLFCQNRRHAEEPWPPQVGRWQEARTPFAASPAAFGPSPVGVPLPLEDENVLAVEAWASSCLGEAWLAAGMTGRALEQMLCLEAVGRASAGFARGGCMGQRAGAVPRVRGSGPAYSARADQRGRRHCGRQAGTADTGSRLHDDKEAWGPAKQVSAALAARGVDLTDRGGVDGAVRALTAARLTQQYTGRARPSDS